MPSFYQPLVDPVRPRDSMEIDSRLSAAPNQPPFPPNCEPVDRQTGHIVAAAQTPLYASTPPPSPPLPTHVAHMAPEAGPATSPSLRAAVLAQRSPPTAGSAPAVAAVEAGRQRPRCARHKRSCMMTSQPQHRFQPPLAGSAPCGTSGLRRQGRPGCRLSAAVAVSMELTPVRHGGP